MINKTVSSHTLELLLGVLDTLGGLCPSGPDMRKLILDAKDRVSAEQWVDGIDFAFDGHTTLRGHQILLPVC